MIASFNLCARVYLAHKSNVPTRVMIAPYSSGTATRSVTADARSMKSLPRGAALRADQGVSYFPGLRAWLDCCLLQLCPVTPLASCSQGHKGGEQTNAAVLASPCQVPTRGPAGMTYLTQSGLRLEVSSQQFTGCSVMSSASS